MSILRVLVAANFVLFRNSVAALLRDCPGVQGIGERQVDSATTEWVREREPDVVIAEVEPEGSPAFDVFHQLADSAPQTRLIAVSAARDSQIVMSLFRAGVRGCLSGHEPAGELIDTIQAVAGGQVFLCSTASNALIAGCREHC